MQPPHHSSCTIEVSQCFHRALIQHEIINNRQPRLRRDFTAQQIGTRQISGFMRPEPQGRQQTTGNHIDIVGQAPWLEVMIETRGNFAICPIGDTKIDLERFLGFDKKIIAEKLDCQFP